MYAGVLAQESSFKTDSKSVRGSMGRKQIGFLSYINAV
jgi:hypothetical protein